MNPTKTKANRTVAADSATWGLLDPLLQLPGSFLFGNEHPLRPTTIQRQFSAALKNSGVSSIRIHDLRHSHATWLINNGVNIVAVAKRLGHSSINQTLETYAHLLESTDNMMMQTIGNVRKRTVFNHPFLEKLTTSQKKPLFMRFFSTWSTWGESDPCVNLGKVAFYH